MRYVIFYITNNGERHLEQLDSTIDPMAETEKGLIANDDIVDFRVFVPKEQYDYEVNTRKKLEQKIGRVKYALETED